MEQLQSAGVLKLRYSGSSFSYIWLVQVNMWQPERTFDNLSKREAAKSNLPVFLTSSTSAG
jgi:hypothetical protein